MQTRRRTAAPNPGDAEEAGTHSLRRALQIVTIVSEQPGISLTSLAVALGVHKSTAYRLCLALEQAGYLARSRQPVPPSGGRPRSGYHLGLWAFVLGSRAVASLALKRQSPPIMRRLAEQAQLPAYLSIVWNGLSICIDEIPGPAGSVWPGSSVGVPLPVHATASGKLYLARLPETAARTHLEGAGPSPLARSIPWSVDVILTELAQIREQGYALNDEETEYGVRYVGVPICDPQGQFVAGLTLGAMVEQRTRDELVAQLPSLRAAAAAVEARLARESPTRF